MEPQFKIGQKVNAKKFVDCFGKVQEQVNGLTVYSIALIESKSMQPYYRIKADKANGPVILVEAAERFFAAA